MPGGQERERVHLPMFEIQRKDGLRFRGSSGLRMDRNMEAAFSVEYGIFWQPTC